MKNKKSYAKPLKKKQLTTTVAKTSDKKDAQSKKVFGRPSSDKPKRKPNKKFGQKALSMPQPTNGDQNDEADEDESGIEDMLDMMDDEDKELLNGYRSSQKRKRDENDDEDNVKARGFEKEHAHKANAEASKKKKTIDLLPIKNKIGEIITRTTEVDVKDRIYEADDNEDGSGDEEEEVIDSDDDIVNDRVVSVKFGLSIGFWLI